MDRKRSLLFVGLSIVLLAAAVLYWRHFFTDPTRQIEALWASRPASAPKLQTIPGSTSPDGKWKIVEFAFGESTGHVCLVLTDRSEKQFAGIVPADEADFRSTSSFNEGTTLLWSPDSQQFAMHNQGPRHSSTEVFRITSGRLHADGVRTTPAEVLSRAGDGQGKLLSSGHRLKRWKSASELEVEAVLRFESVEKIIPLTLAISTNGD